jgi:hypothetical protein
VGSISGTKPGVKVENLLIPLNPDWYTALASIAAIPPIFQGFHGQLDAAGEGTAALILPVLPGAEPFTLDHLFLVYDRLGAYMASNPCSLRVD